MPEQRQGKGRGGRGADGRSTSSGRGNHYTPTNGVTKSGLPPFNEKTWKQTSTSSISSKAKSLKKLQADQAKLKKSFTKSFATISGKIHELVKAKAKRRKKLHADQAKLKKSLATITGMIDELVIASSDPDTTESDDCQEESAHFQFGNERGFMMAQHDLDLKNIILLDTQSTVDLFCNRKLVQQVSKSDKPMRVQSNGGTIQVTHKATMRGYKHDIWFSKHALTNILSLSNLIQQYRVTYDSTAQTFVVHRETHRKPNMLFKMHANGLHYFDPCDAAFLSTVYDYGEEVAVELPGVDGDLSPNIADAEATDDSIEIDDDLHNSPSGEPEFEQVQEMEPRIETEPAVEVDHVDNNPAEKLPDVQAPTVQEPIQAPDGIPGVARATSRTKFATKQSYVKTDRRDRVIRHVELEGVDGDLSPNIADAAATDDPIEIGDDLDLSPNGETVQEAGNQMEPTIEPDPLDEVETLDDLGEEVAVQLPGVDGDEIIDDIDNSPSGEPEFERLQEMEPCLETEPEVEADHVDKQLPDNIVDAEATNDSIAIDDDLDHSPNGETVHEAANQTEPTFEPDPLDEVETFDDLGEEVAVQLPGVDGDESLHIVVNETTDDQIEIDDLNICPNGATEQEVGNQMPTIEPDPLDEVETVYDYGEEVAVQLPGVDGNAAPSIADAEATDDPIEIDDSNICLNGNTELKPTKALDPHIDPQPEVKVDEVNNEPDAQFQDVPAPTVKEPVQAPGGIPGVRRSTKACFGSLFKKFRHRILPQAKTNNKSHKKQGDRLARHG
jgi:hypothetical protein